MAVGEDLDVELAGLVAPLVCRSCGHGFPQHEDAGGHCRDVIGGWSSPAAGFPCMCPGFRWVPLDGPPVGSYGDPPQSAAGA
jgi:hypothetical protein